MTKVDELFHFAEDIGMRRLEDGRSVAFYQLRPGDILETTSNPFFVACTYILLQDAKAKQQANPNDKKMYNVLERSKIHKSSTLQVLFNSSKNDGDTQPPMFTTVNEFVEFVRTHPKKGMEMSDYTVQRLWDFWQAFIDIDMGKDDPVGYFVNRYAIRLGFRGNEAQMPPDNLERGVPNQPAMNDNGKNKKPRKKPMAASGKAARNDSLGHGVALGGGFAGGVTFGGGVPPRGRLALAGGVAYEDGAAPRGRLDLAVGVAYERGAALGGHLALAGGVAYAGGAALGDHDVGGAALGGAGRKGNGRGKANTALCESCEVELATVYCAQCEDGMIICGQCDRFTHQGAARRHHVRKDVAAAPKRSRAYRPHAYMAPFAMLLGLYSGHQKVPLKMSMIEDELKECAQQLTDTDLSDRSAGRPMSGFEVVNSLITRDLLRREGTQQPTYALTEAGVQLSRRLLAFHNCQTMVLRRNNVPSLNMETPVDGLKCGTRRVCLIIDEQEQKRNRLVQFLASKGVATQIRRLPAGDYVWVLLPPGASAEYDRVVPDRELVLPVIVERKSWDDLSASLKDDRYMRQVQTIKRCGLRDKFYLVEGSVNDMRSKPSEENKQAFKLGLIELMIKEDFYLSFTGSWWKTAHWLWRASCILTNSHTVADNRMLHTYEQYCNQARGQVHAPTTPAIDELPHSCAVWKESEFNGHIFSGPPDTNVTKAMQTQLGVVQRNSAERRLLVVEGLEKYNKGRSKVLNDCLAAVLNQEDQGPMEVVEGCLSNQLHHLIHYDVHSYYTTMLQMVLGIHVYRTEDAAHSERVRALYLQHQPMTPEDKPPGDEKRNLVLLPDGELENGGTLEQGDYALDSQGFEEMMKKAVEESKAAELARTAIVEPIVFVDSQSQKSEHDAFSKHTCIDSKTPAMVADVAESDSQEDALLQEALKRSLHKPEDEGISKMPENDPVCDEDEDEELKRAIAMSLAENSGQTEISNPTDNHCAGSGISDSLNDTILVSLPDTNGTNTCIKDEKKDKSPIEITDSSLSLGDDEHNRDMFSDAEEQSDIMLGITVESMDVKIDEKFIAEQKAILDQLKIASPASKHKQIVNNQLKSRCDVSPSLRLDADKERRMNFELNKPLVPDVTKDVVNDEELSRRLQEEEYATDRKSKADTSIDFLLAQHLEETEEQEVAKHQAEMLRQDEELARCLEVETSSINSSLEQISPRKTPRKRPGFDMFDPAPKGDTTSNTAWISSPTTAKMQKLSVERPSGMGEKLSSQLSDYRGLHSRLFSHSTGDTSIPSAPQIASVAPNVRSDAFPRLPTTGSGQTKLDAVVIDDESVFKVKTESVEDDEMKADIQSACLANTTCGNCKQKGHNRKYANCPEYNSPAEKQRRQLEENRRREKKEEAQRHEEETINELTAERDGLEQHKVHLEGHINRMEGLVEKLQRKQARRNGEPLPRAPRRGRGRGRGRGLPH